MSIQLSTRVMHIKDETTGSYDTVDILKGSGIDDVQVNGTSVVEDGVANIPLAGIDELGVVKLQPIAGITRNTNGLIMINRASDSNIKSATDLYNPIVPYNQHTATFYGLAKAAGDATQSASTYSVGTYTDDAKIAIKSMIGVIDPAVNDVQINGTSILNQGVANVPIADSSSLGVIKVNPDNGLRILSGGTLAVYQASDANIKNATNDYRPIVAKNQHSAAFYGLAKAASDTTQSASSNAVGTYTDSAKAKIQTMLGMRKMSEIIIDYTVPEDSADVIINTDTNGNPFIIDTALIYVKFPEVYGNDYISASILMERYSDSADVYLALPTMKLLNNLQTTLVYFTTFVNGIPIMLGKSSVDGNAQAAQWATKFGLYNKIKAVRLQRYSSATQIIPAGTTIKVYGTRYFE